MAAFPPHQRGLALGIRQTAIPLAGFVVALTLPHVAHASVGWGFASLGIAMPGRDRRSAASSIADVPAPDDDDEHGEPLRDAPALAGLRRQRADRRAADVRRRLHRPAAPRPPRPVGRARGGGARGRAGTRDRGADRRRALVGRRRSRLGPLRTIAVADAVLVVGVRCLLDRPLVVLLPLLVVAGVLSMSWNGLSFAAAIELAGHRRSGVAIGLQQSVLNGCGAVYPGPLRRARRSDERGRGASSPSPRSRLLGLAQSCEHCAA